MFYNWLRKFNTSQPADRGMYAINTGLYVGEFFVYIKQDKDTYYFVSLPKLIKRTMPKDKFEVGLKNKIMTLIETLPKNVFEYCNAAFNKG